MHPHRRAARDPLRDRLVCEDLTLPAGDGSEQRDPVADLLTPVAAVALDLGVGETDERLDIAASNVIEDAMVEIGVDLPGLGRADPVRDPAGGEECDALRRGPGGSAERSDERADLVAPPWGRQRRCRAVRVDWRDRNVTLRGQEMQLDRQLVPALDLVRVGEVEAGGETTLEERSPPLGSARDLARWDPHQPRAPRARRLVAPRQADA